MGGPRKAPQRPPIEARYGRAVHRRGSGRTFLSVSATRNAASIAVIPSTMPPLALVPKERSLMCSSATARPTSAIRRRSLLSSVASYGWHRDAEARQDYLRCSDGQEHLTSQSQRPSRPPQKTR